MLRILVQDTVHERERTFCGKQASQGDPPFAVPMGAVAREVYAVATTFYRSFDEASVFEGEAFETALDTDEVIYHCAGGAFDDAVSEEALAAIARGIATPALWFEDDWRNQFAYSWEQFSKTVRTQSRFVFIATPRPGGDDEPPARLARFLDGLLAYADKQTRMLHTLPSGTRLYRGRMADTPELLRAEAENAPAEKLGTAPPSRAGASRMSGEGVPLFYAADNLRTAVAEIALHSPYNSAVVGEFVTQRPLTIVDFTRTPQLPSVFDYARNDRRAFVEFVDEFVSAITRPVVLDGRERVEYIPTQVVTEYLRWVPTRRIDGIAFPSRADKHGKNIVLFTGPSDDVVSDPLTADEAWSLDLARRLAFSHPVTLVIKRTGITVHAVSRSVRAERVWPAKSLPEERGSV